MDDVARLADALAGVRRTAPQGLAEWRYHGRLVARQLDDAHAHLVIRADFDYRDSLLRQFPGTFSVPARFTKHMMIVADIARGEAGAIEHGTGRQGNRAVACRVPGGQAAELALDALDRGVVLPRDHGAAGTHAGPVDLPPLLGVNPKLPGQHLS